MITAEVEQNVDADAWNARVYGFPGGSIFQTTYWASCWVAYLGARPHYLILRDGKDIVGQLLTLEVLRGHEAFLGKIPAGLGRLGSSFLRVLSWREGPLVSDACRPDETLLMFLKTLENLASERNVTGIEHVSLPICQYSGARMEPVFAENGFEVHRRATVRIDVQLPLEDLWAGLKQGVTRTPIRKSKRQGLILYQVQNLEDLKQFHQLVTAWRKEEQLPPYHFERYAEMFATMHPHCVFFLTEYAERIVAGAGVWHFNGQAHLFDHVTASLARQQRVYAGDFLYWEMIRWCHEKGLSIFDLSGISPFPTSAKEAGIRRFNTKWGGDVVEYPVFTRVLKPKQWKLASVIQDARHTVRKWHRRG